ncbi:MAG: sulfate adenylyltransferase [Dehalococcoidia bacterium]|nr:sulfate adenylyltransferase [Dehalococcoidia bacterium]MYD27763.1 sulfate adenylyltransferase [Dehalococcoidia bacterium]
MSNLGEPYGGTLVDLLVDEEEHVELGREVASLPTIELDSRHLADFELLANGGFSPLTGFMGEADYRSVVENMTLANGLPWSMPVTLSVDESRAGELTPGVRADLRDDEGFPLGVIDIEEVYRRDKTRLAEQVYRTTDEAHPGVAAVYASGDLVLGGTVKALRLPDHGNFPDHRLTPAQTRAAFAERGWRTVVGFQTRNPIHRAHEYLIKVALEGVDGALIHPLVGDTKDDDIPADVRMQCYQVLLDRYFPEDRVQLSVLPAAMRYAGPREAIFHAIMRKNYGCTHFIVGRDHAGVGNYYGTYDAQRIFDDIDLDALGIQPLFFEHAFWCLRSGAMATTKTSSATPEERLFLSGTKVREMLANGEDLPVEFTRPEVAAVLMESARSG